MVGLASGYWLLAIGHWLLASSILLLPTQSHRRIAHSPLPRFISQLLNVQPFHHLLISSSHPFFQFSINPLTISCFHYLTHSRLLPFIISTSHYLTILPSHHLNFSPSQNLNYLFSVFCILYKKNTKKFGRSKTNPPWVAAQKVTFCKVIPEEKVTFTL
jgi:hypothetical protein